MVVGIESTPDITPVLHFASPRHSNDAEFESMHGCVSVQSRQAICAKVKLRSSQFRTDDAPVGTQHQEQSWL